MSNIPSNVLEDKWFSYVDKWMLGITTVILLLSSLGLIYFNAFSHIYELLINYSKEEHWNNFLLLFYLIITTIYAVYICIFFYFFFYRLQLIGLNTGLIAILFIPIIDSFFLIYVIFANEKFTRDEFREESNQELVNKECTSKKYNDNLFEIFKFCGGAIFLIFIFIGWFG